MIFYELNPNIFDIQRILIAMRLKFSRPHLYTKNNPRKNRERRGSAYNHYCIA